MPKLDNLGKWKVAQLLYRFGDGESELIFFKNDSIPNIILVKGVVRGHLNEIDSTNLINIELRPGNYRNVVLIPAYSKYANDNNAVNFLRLNSDGTTEYYGTNPHHAYFSGIYHQY